MLFREVNNTEGRRDIKSQLDFQRHLHPSLISHNYLTDPMADSLLISAMGLNGVDMGSVIGRWKKFKSCAIEARHEVARLWSIPQAEIKSLLDVFIIRIVLTRPLSPTQTFENNADVIPNN